MNTIIINSQIKIELDAAVKMLNDGQTAAFPTDTVFGLGAALDNINACRSIFQVKEREAKKPLAAHISSLEMAVSCFSQTSELFYKIADLFLPGPLAIIMPKDARVSYEITGGFDTISIRYPDSKECLDLINAFGRPVAATSANISGEKSLLSTEEVHSAFNGKIGFILSGKCKYNSESTIISLAGEPTILRRGIIPKEEIESKAGIKLREIN